MAYTGAGTTTHDTVKTKNPNTTTLNIISLLSQCPGYHIIHLFLCKVTYVTFVIDVKHMQRIVHKCQVCKQSVSGTFTFVLATVGYAYFINI